MTGFTERRKLLELVAKMHTAIGGPKMTDEKVQEYQRRLSFYPLDIVAKAIDEAVGNVTSGPDGFREVPAVGDILRIIKAGQTDRAMSRIQTWCQLCGNTGFVSVLFPDRQPLVYRCECANGAHHDPSIRSWADVKGKYTPPEEKPAPKLPLAAQEAVGDEDNYEGGCEIIRVCETCGLNYTIRHERPITGAELKQIYATRPGLCEPCFVEAGKKLGLWT